MRTLFPAVSIVVLALCLTLAGCGELEPPYSSLVKYLLRSDPLVLTEKLGEGADNSPPQPHLPDRPGQMPLLSVKDMLDPIHPLYRMKDKWMQGDPSPMRDPKAAKDEDRAAMEDYLMQIFGTPAHPTVEYIDETQREALKLDSRTLERGSSLYRIHCLHCHGVTGDGRGPTARWVNPHPRDYRQGLFKFQSVDQTDYQRPPRRADLHRVIKYGVEGTAMPAFVLLPDSEIDLLVSYVTHLSIRGKVEYEAFSTAFDLVDGVLEPKAARPLADFLPTMTKIVVNSWIESQAREIKIAPFPFDENDKAAMQRSVVRGQELFLGVANAEAKKANCVNCHTDYGRQAKFRFDKWGTLVRPNNLTNGIYRGGRRTIDVYYRIHSGINGSEMASFGKQLQRSLIKQGNREETIDPIWDLVNFVQTLPYPSMRKQRGINID